MYTFAAIKMHSDWYHTDDFFIRCMIICFFFSSSWIRFLNNWSSPILYHNQDCKNHENHKKAKSKTKIKNLEHKACAQHIQIIMLETEQLNLSLEKISFFIVLSFTDIDHIVFQLNDEIKIQHSQYWLQPYNMYGFHYRVGILIFFSSSNPFHQNQACPFLLYSTFYSFHQFIHLAHDLLTKIHTHTHTLVLAA